MDSKVGIGVAGKPSLVVNDDDHSVSVFEYDPHDGAKKHRTVSAAATLTFPQTVQVYTLVIIQAVHMLI